MSTMNRLYNCKNDYQSDTKKVLCVCSAGLLRSPTTALVLSGHPWNYNTRAAGLSEDFALIPVDDVLVTWADEIVCMDRTQADILRAWVDKVKGTATVVSLDIADSYAYRDPVLIKIITERYNNR